MKKLLLHPTWTRLGSAVAIAALCIGAAGCDSKSEKVPGSPAQNPAATAPSTTPLTTPSTTSQTPTGIQNDCKQAIQRLRQCHQQVAASGKASDLQLQRSTTYLRRLEAWWQMEPGNPAIRATCSAIASDNDGCASDGESEGSEDSAMTEEHFNQVMKQFDAAGVPP